MEALCCVEKYGMGKTYNYRKQIEDGLLQAIPNQIKEKCSVKRILRTIITILKINMLECALLAWLLKKSKYNFGNIQSQQNEGYQQDLNNTVEKFILLRGYQVKQQLSDSYVNWQIEKQVNNHYKWFHAVYKDWKPQLSLNTLTINQINKIFQDWNSNQNKNSHVDYNKLVSRILDLSKCYNVSDKEEVKNEGKKKRKGSNHKDNSQVQSLVPPLKNSKYTLRKYQSIENILDEEEFDYHEDKQIDNNIRFDKMRSISRNNFIKPTFSFKSEKDSLFQSKKSFDFFNSSIVNTPKRINLRSSSTLNNHQGKNNHSHLND